MFWNEFSKGLKWSATISLGNLKNHFNRRIDDSSFLHIQTAKTVTTYFCNVNSVPVICLHLLTKFSSLFGSSFRNLKRDSRYTVLPQSSKKN